MSAQASPPVTIEDAIWTLWRNCLMTARAAGQVPAEAVQKLIRQSREIIVGQGYTKRDSDLILCGVYTAVHWDWPQPTDRVFETLLEFELAEFFRERMDN